MEALHHDPEQWIKPEKFIPERFDPSSPYFLTPSGKKRHPMSFGPFLGGKRVCLGKTLVEVLSRVLMPAIIYQFDFDFVKPEEKLNKPENNLGCPQEPEIMMTIKTITH